MTKIISLVAITATVLALSGCSAKDATSSVVEGAKGATSSVVGGTKDAVSAVTPSTDGLKDKAVDKAVDMADTKTDGKASQVINLVK